MRVKLKNEDISVGCHSSRKLHGSNRMLQGLCGYRDDRRDNVGSED